MGRGVLTKYKNAADAQRLSYVEASRLSNEDLEKFLKSTRPEPVASEQKKTLEELIPDYVNELAHNRYLTVQRLHEKYRNEYPDGYGYTQFKKQIRDYQYAHNLSFHNEYLPGEEIQIDFAGDALWLTDPKTGATTEVAVLVCVLPFSGIGYIKALPNASMENFFGGLSDALTFFGGTTRKAKSDNMKQWVKKHDRYEPVFNDAAVEWAAYYNTSLEACRVRAPRDKGPVEGIVDKFYKAIYVEVHDEIFFDINQMNSRLIQLLDEFNNKVSRATGKSRYDIFMDEEKPFLQELPAMPYRFRYRKTVKLTGSYHIQIDNRKYSAPYQYVGQMVNVVWDIDTVEIYSGAKRIAIHERYGKDLYSTKDEHMPENHLAYKHGQGHNAAYFMEEAEAIGPYTKRAVDLILKRGKYVEHSYNACFGILSLRRYYGKERLENACMLFKEVASVTYTMIKNVLQKNLDVANNQSAVSMMPSNDYVRGASSFNI
jgi:transposase